MEEQGRDRQGRDSTAGGLLPPQARAGFGEQLELVGRRRIVRVHHKASQLAPDVVAEGNESGGGVGCRERSARVKGRYQPYREMRARRANSSLPASSGFPVSGTGTDGMLEP